MKKNDSQITELANAVRALSIDMIERAKSGHPGAPLGMADIATVLWRDFLQHNPQNPNFYNHDRFVLSNGHASTLLYSLLHLTGYELNIDDLKAFRQLHSKTAGHPENVLTPGVETSTGPLGQGLANAVGMALAEKILASQFNRPNLEIVNHFTYAFVGDGCLMEGISHEACSLAGTHGLGKLIVLYDDNGISIDGEVSSWFSDDTVHRFESYNWQVIRNVDGHNAAEITLALQSAQENTTQPTLICCKTVIGFGSPNKQNSNGVHGSPLGADEAILTKQQLSWNYPPFDIPAHIYNAWNAKQEGQQLENNWQQLFASYQQQYPELAAEFIRRMQGNLPADFADSMQNFINEQDKNPQTIATRKASFNVLAEIVPQIPELIGGSADLASSNLTLTKSSKPISSCDADGNYIYYGVREFGMSAIMNGLALHGGFIPYGATFLIFMEYARNAIRMAALMRLRAIYVLTHDSIGVGEDGPTHQPIEQLTNLRTTPNLDTWRPCDAVETACAWQNALTRNNGPSALILSRQNLTPQQRSTSQISAIHKGGYVLFDNYENNENTPDLILIATGSEVELAVSAAKQINAKVRVVSMPCVSRFEQQESSYQEQVLPSKVHNRIAIEAAHPDFWHKYVGLDGKIIGINRFGASAPAADLFNEFDITVENIIKQAKELLA